MTAAVCLQCGEIKMGAWTPCRNCGHTPADDEDKAKHLFLSDHILSAADIDRVSADIRKGKPPQFDAAQLGEMLAAMKSMPTTPQVDVRKVKIGCFVVLAVIVGVVVWLVLR